LKSENASAVIFVDPRHDALTLVGYHGPVRVAVFSFGFFALEHERLRDDEVSFGTQVVAPLVIPEVLDHRAEVKLDVVRLKDHFLPKADFSRVFDEASVHVRHDSFDLNNQDLLR
jgi:hypothetical protein